MVLLAWISKQKAGEPMSERKTQQELGTVRETGTFFNDQAHIVYVNSQIKDETAYGTP